MPIALVFASTNDTNLPIRRLWDDLGRYEDPPSMEALNYLPHITLAVYDRLDVEQAYAALDAVAAYHPAAVRLTFTRVRHFDGLPLVLWAAPEPDAALADAHALVHELIDPALCRPHYRPGAWVPHCTVATGVPDERRDEALAFAGGPIAPFSVLFDRLDCVRFPPVTLLRAKALNGPNAPSSPIRE
jgi:2'-5' RNA ligase